MPQHLNPKNLLDFVFETAAFLLNAQDTNITGTIIQNIYKALSVNPKLYFSYKHYLLKF